MIETETNNLENEGLDIETLDLGTGNLDATIGGVFSKKPVTVTFEDGTTQTIHIITA